MIEECAKLACDLSSTCHRGADGAYRCVAGTVCDSVSPCKNGGSCSELPNSGELHRYLVDS